MLRRYTTAARPVPGIRSRRDLWMQRINNPWAPVGSSQPLRGMPYHRHLGRQPTCRFAPLRLTSGP